MYAPLSMFRWQMYAAQGMRNRWYSVLGEDFIDSNDEDQDSLKVELSTCLYNCSHGQFIMCPFVRVVTTWYNSVDYIQEET